MKLLPAEARILEIGCGAGANFELYPDSRLVVSSEISIKMLEIAAGKLRGNHLIQADAQSLPLDDNEFDAAFATLVFCSIPDPALAFGELRRVVKAGGRIVLLEHVRPDGLLGRVFDIVNTATVALAGDHFNRETARIAESAGLKMVEVRKKMASIVNLIVCEVPAAS